MTLEELRLQAARQRLLREEVLRCLYEAFLLNPMAPTVLPGDLSQLLAMNKDETYGVVWFLDREKLVIFNDGKLRIESTGITLVERMLFEDGFVDARFSQTSLAGLAPTLGH